MRILKLIIFIQLIIFSAFLSAHQLSTAYANLQINDQGLITGEWQVRLYDLEQAIGVDSDGDGKLRWKELQARADSVHQYLASQLSIHRADSTCTLLLSDEWKIDSHFSESYLLIPLRAQCALTGTIRVNYSAFFKEDAEHKLLLNLRSDSATSSRVLSDTQRNIDWDAASGNIWKTLGEFIYQGMVHIWIGIDHILFLLSLLLTCVLVRRGNQWFAQASIKRILINTTWIVTAFTLAHSITLSATALGLIQFSSQWVEVGIAISVVLVALNNIYPLVTRLGWLTFGFGLLHGMGFAGVLGELGLPADQQLLTVLAFNLGVEIGQMAIVLLLLPLFIFVRNQIWYARYALTGTSIVIALVALQWVVDRWIG
ncbi:HupE/UreJ family protein [Cellvibrio fibrivorans]|uniref:HupE / UreJ protein n=1 Tax=Cellvibrio fibrivorans TaxID=126350 RepID=A0ABU1UUG2_9GAMM|nr:HupE/UreJ family protein [Cellvibrio fibrivorans]MDR7088809.1 hypothetical protein [Cellvibrio fibrivorans]